MGGSWSPARLQSEGPHGSLLPLSLFPSLQWGPVLNPCLAPSWHVPRWSESAKPPGTPRLHLTVTDTGCPRMAARSPRFWRARELYEKL